MFKILSSLVILDYVFCEFDDGQVYLYVFVPFGPFVCALSFLGLFSLLHSASLITLC